MGKFKYKIELYNYLAETQGKLFEEGKKIPSDIGMPDELLGKVGLSGDGVGMPRPDAQEGGRRRRGWKPQGHQ